MVFGEEEPDASVAFLDGGFEGLAVGEALEGASALGEFEDLFGALEAAHAARDGAQVGLLKPNDPLLLQVKAHVDSTARGTAFTVAFAGGRGQGNVAAAADFTCDPPACCDCAFSAHESIIANKRRIKLWIFRVRLGVFFAFLVELRGWFGV